MIKKELRKEMFAKYYGDNYYFYDFIENGIHYQIQIDPCKLGLYVSLRKRNEDTGRYRICGPRITTFFPEYQQDPMDEKPREKYVWRAALKFADYIYNNIEK